MDRSELMDHLDMARRKAKLVEEMADRQREVIAKLFAEGFDTSEAENRLRALQLNRHRHLADAERFLMALQGRVAFSSRSKAPDAAQYFHS